MRATSGNSVRTRLARVSFFARSPRRHRVNMLTVRFVASSMIHGSRSASRRRCVVLSAPRRTIADASFCCCCVVVVTVDWNVVVVYSSAWFRKTVLTRRSLEGREYGRSLLFDDFYRLNTVQFNLYDNTGRRRKLLIDFASVCLYKLLCLQVTLISIITVSTCNPYLLK